MAWRAWGPEDGPRSSFLQLDLFSSPLPSTSLVSSPPPFPSIPSFFGIYKYSWSVSISLPGKVDPRLVTFRGPACVSQPIISAALRA